MDEAYNAYSRFNKFQRAESLSIDDYILDFENLYEKMSQHEAIRAFRLLDGANLEENDRKFALTIANDMKFERCFLNTFFKTWLCLPIRDWVVKLL